MPTQTQTTPLTPVAKGLASRSKKFREFSVGENLDSLEVISITPTQKGKKNTKAVVKISHDGAVRVRKISYNRIDIIEHVLEKLFISKDVEVGGSVYKSYLTPGSSGPIVSYLSRPTFLGGYNIEMTSVNEVHSVLDSGLNLSSHTLTIPDDTLDHKPGVYDFNTRYILSDKMNTDTANVSVVNANNLDISSGAFKHFSFSDGTSVVLKAFDTLPLTTRELTLTLGEPRTVPSIIPGDLNQAWFKITINKGIVIEANPQYISDTVIHTVPFTDAAKLELGFVFDNTQGELEDLTAGYMYAKVDNNVLFSFKTILCPQIFYGSHIGLTYIDSTGVYTDGIICGLDLNKTTSVVTGTTDNGNTDPNTDPNTNTDSTSASDSTTTTTPAVDNTHFVVANANGSVNISGFPANTVKTVVKYTKTGESTVSTSNFSITGDKYSTSIPTTNYVRVNDTTIQLKNNVVKDNSDVEVSYYDSNNVAIGNTVTVIAKPDTSE